ncbi:MAG TPA: outer membrane protein assembly factor BamE [Methylotenera sp.]|nr:outer membrane protein assembly factor BamE [Methylotenera sp.]
MRYFSTLRNLLILSVLLCASCGTALPTVKPYKLDVQQGNVVTSKMLLQLRPGMTKSQVRFIMGTPLIQDSFHGNRWDYVYQLREGGKIKEQRRVILDFENELLKSVRGDVIPAGSDKDKAADEATNKGTRVVKPNSKPEDKSLMDKLKFWKKDEAPADAKKEAGEASPATVAPVKEEAVTPAEQAAPAEEPKSPESKSIEEPKSLLVVPVEQMAVPETPVVNTPPAEPAVAPVVVEPAKAESAPAEQAKVEPAPVSVPEPQPENAPPYESGSGMQFDRNLKLAPEEVAVEPKPVVAAPRAGNKTPPKPRDLPAEGDPGFFERMLEKIGF